VLAVAAGRLDGAGTAARHRDRLHRAFRRIRFSLR
jgi:hypothetical protein